MHPFAAVGKSVSRRSAKYPFGERTRSGPAGTPAPTSARRGGSERNALGGAELSLLEADTAAQTGGKKIVRSGKKILIFPVLSCKI